jgi:hypothetical protein
MVKLIAKANDGCWGEASQGLTKAPRPDSQQAN